MIQLISFIQSRLAATSDDDRGAGMVEYGLLVAFIALVALVGVQALGVKLDTLFNSINF